MKLYDISMTIHENMVVYKNKENKKPKLTTVATHTENNMHETDISLNLHTGTHMDFPLHAIKNGKVSDDYSIDDFYGKALVIDCTLCSDSITLKDVEVFDISKFDFVLFKTKIENIDTFDFEFIYLSIEAANYLSKFKLKGVGIDSLGIERNQPDHSSHITLLSKDILIYEGIDLTNISSGSYTFIGMPIKFQNTEASLVRAILIED